MSGLRIGTPFGFFTGVAATGLVTGLGLTLYLGTIFAKQPAAVRSRAGVQSANESRASTQNPPPGGRGARRAGFHFHEPSPLDFNDHTGYVSLFDGKDLKGWDGDPSVWRVEDGAIVGVSTPEHRVHTYLVYRGLKAKDFDLKLEIKVTGGGGSGIQYRSTTGLPWRAAGNRGEPPVVNLNWMMTGPQADFWFPVTPRTADFTGQFYTENSPLGIIAWRGEVVQMAPGRAPRLVGRIGNREALGGYVRVNDWNQYLIMARGGTFIHILNGQLMAVLVDDNPNDVNNHAGMFGIEIEGAPSTVSVRDIWLRKLP
jgi:hypothetical protein